MTAMPHVGPSALPTPPEWAERRTFRAVRSVAGLAVLAVGLAAMGGFILWSGDLPIGIPLVAVAILLGHIVVLGIRGQSIRRRRRTRAQLIADPKATAKGVRFTYSAWAYYWVTAVLVMTVLLALALAAVRLAAPDTVLDIVGGIIFGGSALFIGWFLVTLLRLAPGEVTLSPAGVFHRSLTSTHFVPWSAVVDVTAQWHKTPLLTVDAHPSEETRVRRYMGRLGAGELEHLPGMVIRTSWLASDPVVVYHAVRFYHAHPDLRAELSTPDGPARINSGWAICGEARAVSPIEPG
ncbi:MAG TPA: hypothetical protein VHN18_18195 [Micromonosporaceae bacterium]|nr:hypothetical protein [Micromonosporaceae bacterium]